MPKHRALDKGVNPHEASDTKEEYGRMKNYGAIYDFVVARVHRQGVLGRFGSKTYREIDSQEFVSVLKKLKHYMDKGELKPDAWGSFVQAMMYIYYLKQVHKDYKIVMVWPQWAELRKYAKELPDVV